MVWDKTLPQGNTKISAGDNSIRDNNDQLETAIDLEHAFTTGGTQTGRHTFDRDTVSNRNAPSVAYEDGSIFFATDVRSGKKVLQVMDSSIWENVDVDPGDLPRTDEQSQFTACQFAQWQEITPTPGTPDTVAIDLTSSPFKYVTMVGDTLIQNPSGSVSGYGTIVTLDLEFDSGGPYSVTWGTSYRAVGGTVPLDKTASGRTMLTLIVNRNGNVVVTSQPGFNVGSVTS